MACMTLPMPRSYLFNLQVCMVHSPQDRDSTSSWPCLHAHNSQNTSSRGADAVHVSSKDAVPNTHQVHCVWGHALAEHLRPGVSLDLGELEFSVVGVHGVNLLAGGRAQHLNDLHQLVHTTLAREQRLPQQQLCHHAANGPHVDGSSVISCAEDELGSTVVARADVGDVGLASNEDLQSTVVEYMHELAVNLHWCVVVSMNGMDAVATWPWIFSQEGDEVKA
eukprot:1157845-Pelagomonas_calceolata.AAC.3